MLSVKQYFCKHSYDYIAEHMATQSNLLQCKKCEVFYIQHYGIGIGYRCKVPNIGGWERVGQWRERENS